MDFFCFSYAVASGLIEILSRRCMKIRESVEVHQSVVLSLLATIGLLTKVIDVCPPGEFLDFFLFSNIVVRVNIHGGLTYRQVSRDETD